VTSQLKRSGEVKFTTEAFTEYLKGDSITIPKGIVNFPALIYGEIDTGTEDSFWLRNSTFSCKYTIEGATIVSAALHNDPSSCINGGIASFGYLVNADSNETDGSITFDHCQVNSHSPF